MSIRRNIRLFPGLLMVCLLGSWALPQSAAPRLMARDAGGADGPGEAMRLQALAVEVRITGFLAETRLVMTFFNPHDRILEGELLFPLPEGAVVSGYALDVNGVMVDGVAVEKAKGQRVFETVVRRGVDPGLVEWVRGNNFRTRVYPLPPRGTRVVMVRYVTELDAGAEAFEYRLPLRLGEPLDDFKLRIVVEQVDSAPRVVEGGPAGLRFRDDRAGYRAEYQVRDARLDGELRLAIPRADTQRVLVEKAADGWHYFCVLDEPAAAPPAGKAAAPHRVALYWDASGSRARADLARELELLRAYFGRFPRRTVPVDLVVFRNEPDPPQRLDVADGDTRALEATLAAVVYDGGTQLGALPGPGLSRRPSLCLVVTDGNTTIGGEIPGRFAAPVYAISADLSANHALLRHLAESGGGEYLNLGRTDPAAAAARIGTPRRILDRIDFDPARVDQPFPSGARPAPGRVILAGRLMGREAAVAFRYATGRQQSRSGEYRVRREGAPEGNLLRTYWAQRKVDELAAFPERNRAELTATGKQYGLVTPATSLLVLESLDQYIEFEIEPPAEFPGWRKIYAWEVDQWKAAREDRRIKKLAALIAMWAECVTCWEALPPAPKEKKAERPRASTPAAPATPPSVTGKAERTAPLPAQISGSPRRPNAPLPLVSGGGTLVGTVRDATGGVIPAVTITVTTDRLGRSTVTGDDGKYYFSFLPAQVYRLRAFLNGFKDYEIKNLTVNEGVSHELDLVLTPGEITEVVIVHSEKEVVEPPTTLLDKSESLDAVSDGFSKVHGTREGADITTENGSSSESEHSVLEVDFSHSLNGRYRMIELLPWAPDLPYVRALRAAAADEMYALFLEHRADFGDSPGFYLDCADLFVQKGLPGLGLRVLSNLAELRLDDAGLLRVLALRLAQTGHEKLAAGVFRRVAALRPKEPQSLRDLALVLARLKQYREALDLLNQVVMSDWDRFNGIEVTALKEANALIPLARAAGVTEIPIAPELVKLLDCDLRIVLTWDTDATDIDLHVFEPSGEEVYCRHPRSAAGGRLSQNFTNGYGPEEYLIRRALRGAYRVEADYCGTHSQKLLAPVTLQVEIFTDFGRPTEKRRSVTLRLDESKDRLRVAEVTF